MLDADVCLGSLADIGSGSGKSALLLKADMYGAEIDVGYVPTADIGGADKLGGTLTDSSRTGRIALLAAPAGDFREECQAKLPIRPAFRLLPRHPATGSCWHMK
jgi:hypothetical protein